MKGNDWLDELKVGDRVCWHSRYRGYEFETIEKITPSKQIKTRRYTFKNGYCRLDSWEGIHLEPITQKILDIVRAKKLFNEIKDYRFDKLNLEQLEKLHEVLRGFAQSAIVTTESPSHEVTAAEGGTSCNA